MFNKNNYYTKIQSIEITSLPEALRKGHSYVDKVSSHGTNWSVYDSSDTIKKVVDTYFEKLSAHRDKATKPEKLTKTTPVKIKEKTERSTPARKASGRQKGEPLFVERLPEELRLIRRFVNLNGKVKTKEELLRFINTLQKAILEKKVRKTSTHAEHIRFIQKRLIDAYNSMGAKVKVELKQETYDSLKKLASGEKILTSVNFIKRYINMNGKPGMKQKAKELLTKINRAYEKGKVNNSDPYIVEMHEIKKKLENFISSKGSKVLEIEPNTLNGLEGILGCACNSVNGLGNVPAYKPTIMNSMDFAKLRFNTIGMKGKWLKLIGDPSTNFTAMVFGKPKMGKSFLCVDFAGYLARNHGRVLYVAKEEGLDKTLQDKLNDKDVQHPNLFVSSELPANLSSYDFIFLDSVNKMGLRPEELNRIKAANPDKSFIYIFQTTKSGAFRGANTFQHDVDSVIEVPERGRAVQYGRFNQGGEMDIFNDTYDLAA